jgi:hypothetical protein
MSFEDQGKAKAVREFIEQHMDELAKCATRKEQVTIIWEALGEDSVSETVAAYQLRAAFGVVNRSKKQPTPLVSEEAAYRGREQLAGLDGFRRMFDSRVRIKSEIDDLINTKIKEQGWMLDAEIWRHVRCRVDDREIWRREYAHLIVEPRSLEGKGKKIVWCHPSIVEDARDIAARS